MRNAYGSIGKQELNTICSLNGAYGSDLSHVAHSLGVALGAFVVEKVEHHQSKSGQTMDQQVVAPGLAAWFLKFLS